MTWLQRYQLKQMMQWSLWLMPILAICLAMVVALILRWIDHTSTWNWFNLTPDGARAILSAFTSSMLTFVVFVLSSLLIVVQLASAQLTPRIIAMVFEERRLKWVLSIFTFDYTFTISVLGRIEATALQLSGSIAILCNLVCIIIFFWFVQWLGGSLRPSAVLQNVAKKGRAVVESIYPNPFDASEEQPGWSPSPTSHVIVVDHIGTSGVVLAFNQRELVVIAERAEVVIELVPQVGNYVARGDPLFRIRIGGRPIDSEELRSCIAIGSERTMEQDPRFAFRIMVDIANKALSPAINDPTTAVLALDQVHRLLMYIGKRRLNAGQANDSHGKLRLCYGTQDWIDFVSLAVTEIRHFGTSSMQVARRLHAMLDHLILVLPDARKPALQQELRLLERAIQRSFPDEEDRAHAVVGDLQGIGG